MKLHCAAESAMKHYNMLKNNIAKSGRSEFKRKFQNRNSHSYISRTLKGVMPAPMGCLKWPKGHVNEGKTTTDPDDIDDILRQVWQGITHGDPRDLDMITNDFMIKYGKYVVNRPELKMGDFDFHDFKDIPIRPPCG